MTRRFAIPIVILGGLTVAITVFLIIPTIGDIKRLNEQITDERARLETRYAKRHTVRKAIEFVENLRGELHSLRSIALEEGHEIDLVSAVETIAGQTGIVHQIRLTPSADTSKKGYDRRLEIEIDARGDALAVGRFFEGVERLSPAFIDQTLSLSRLADGAMVTALWRASVAWPEPQ